MDAQIAVYVLVGIVLLLFIKRTISVRSLKQYLPTELDSLIQSKSNVVLLDVRTNDERQLGSIRGSIHIPLQTLRARTKELDKYRNKQIVCYCQTGGRSVKAALQLRKSGFDIANLKGGMADWNFTHR